MVGWIGLAESYPNLVLFFKFDHALVGYPPPPSKLTSGLFWLFLRAFFLPLLSWALIISALRDSKLWSIEADAPVKVLALYLW